MNTLKKIGKIIIPKILFNAAQPYWHRLQSLRASLMYGYPARKMVIIGVTGTKGKTSTANYIWSVLTAAGYKAGLIGTANIRIGEKERLNPYHMTMPGAYTLQKLLYTIHKAGCTHCVLEITSEGIKLNRHKGVYPDVVLFTNLFPEHLPSHGGSFEMYKATKVTIFSELMGSRRKKILSAPKKTIIANVDSEHAKYFLNFNAEQKITFGIHTNADIKAERVSNTERGATFNTLNVDFKTSIPGIFNVYNALGAIAVGKALSVPLDKIKEGISSLFLIPGRMEKIESGQPFTVFVDYAHEKESMGLLLATAQEMVNESGSKIIVLLGAEGGGRDKAKRPAMGELAGKLADYVIVSNVDPYADDPKEIIEDIAKVAETQGKVRGENLFTIEDRREGIRKALSLAHEGDVVLITGKGSEQSMIIGEVTIPWDDRDVVREELEKLLG